MAVVRLRGDESAARAPQPLRGIVRLQPRLAQTRPILLAHNILLAHDHVGSAAIVTVERVRQNSAMAAALFSAFALYIAIGVAVGLAFVLFGVTRALPHPTPVSAGSRIVLLPGSVLLWPLVLRRWLKSRSDR